jgi:hypothetical protein
VTTPEALLKLDLNVFIDQISKLHMVQITFMAPKEGSSFSGTLLATGCVCPPVCLSVC